MNHDLISASFTWFHPNLYCSQHGLFFCLAFGVLKTPSKLVSVPMACPCVVEMWPRARPGRHPLVYKMGSLIFQACSAPLWCTKWGSLIFQAFSAPLWCTKWGSLIFQAFSAPLWCTKWGSLTFWHSELGMGIFEQMASANHR